MKICYLENGLWLLKYAERPTSKFELKDGDGKYSQT